MIKRILKKVMIILGIILAAAALLFAVSLIPTLQLKNGNMQVLSGEWIDVYYETQEAAAKDVFALVETEAKRLTQKLGFSEKQNITLYIYDSQKTFQTKKYGFIAPLLNLHWYIGDNRGTDTILASPGEAVHQNEYDRRKYAAPHELVHALNSNLNPQMPLWLNEGTALYLTNGNPPKHLYSNSTAPTLAQTDTSNPIAFANMGGYNFAHTYVEFLDQTYGWEQVLSLLKNGDYVAATGTTKEALYLDWIEFLKVNYAGRK